MARESRDQRRKKAKARKKTRQEKRSNRHIPDLPPVSPPPFDDLLRQDAGAHNPAEFVLRLMQSVVNGWSDAQGASANAEGDGFEPFDWWRVRMFPAQGEVDYTSGRFISEYLAALGTGIRVPTLGHADTPTMASVEIIEQLPLPGAVIDELERLRLETLGALRLLLGEGDTFAEAFRSEAVVPDVGSMEEIEARWSPLLQGEIAYWYLGDPVDIEPIVTILMLCDLFLIWLRDRYEILPEHPLGWFSGRALEHRLFTLRLGDDLPHEVLAWLLETFAVQRPEVGGFALPGRRDAPTSDAGITGDPIAHRGGEERYDPDRLLFAMSLPQYREPRTLTGRNRNRYVAILFEGDRVGLDSYQVPNAFYALEGPLDELLRLAQLEKDEIRRHPRCVHRIRHDPAGRWRDQVRAWLAGGS